MKRTEKLLRYMEEHREEYLDKLEKAVSLESPTEGERKDLDACRAYFADLFRSEGFLVSEVESYNPRFASHLLMEYGKNAGSVTEGFRKWEENNKTILESIREGKASPSALPEAKWDGGTGGYVLFGGHYDTVHEKTVFEIPWVISGGKAIGPGALDMKGGDTQVWLIVKALKELGLFPENGHVVFFLSSDEEAGSYGSSAYYKELASHAKATFIMESSVGIVGADPDDMGGLKIGRFGRGNYTFRAEGLPYHSGINPTFAESALIELALQAVRLEQMTFFDKPNKETGERETVTVGCTSLISGKAGWPTVPGDGELTIDSRYSTSALAEEYDALFRSMPSFNPNVKIHTLGGPEKPPFDKDLPGNKKLQNMALELGKDFGVEMKPGMVRGGSDGNFTASTGCPTLDGLGVTGGHVHQKGEYINIAHLPFRTAFTAELLLRVMEQL